MYRIFCSVLASLLLAGCQFTRLPSTPVPTEYFNFDQNNSTLVILLPGFGDAPNRFVEHGTVDQIKACNPQANILGVDAHFGYYRKRSIDRRLSDDVIDPALRSGIDQIWILGISMGGMGSILYRSFYPEKLTGIILMAPFVGDRDELKLYLDDRAQAVQEVESGFIKIWDGLVNIPVDNPSITLAYGEEDGLRPQIEWLAGLLGDDRVISAPGGHNWRVWKQLWPEALQRSGLCTVQ